MITITHTRAEGTLAEGTARGDGSAAPLKSAGFRWSRSLGVWYLPQSRDRRARAYAIEQAVNALREAGFEVVTTIDDVSPGRPVAEIEAERKERSGERAQLYVDRAGSAAGRSAAAYNRARQMSDAIPLGQPVMGARDRAFRARMHAAYDRAFREAGTAEHWSGRAQAAQVHQAYREAVSVTLRRIQRLEATERRLIRTGAEQIPTLAAELESVREKLTYWREHVAAAEAAGVKVWSAANFTRGDYVSFGVGRWYEVVRVNPRTLTVPAGVNIGKLRVVTRDAVKDALGGPGWTLTMPYSDVRGRRSAADIAAALADDADNVAAYEHGSRQTEGDR